MLRHFLYERVAESFLRRIELRREGRNAS
jgi:hypothetical protein